MKRTILFLITIGVLYSCDKNDGTIVDLDLFGNWRLVQMEGSIPNSESTGSEMEWQETYSFDTDGTFQKSRDRDGVVTEISGTFELIDSSNEKIVKLIFNSDSNIIGSCTSESEETLLKSGDMLSSTWKNCDGPGLEYIKMN